MNVKVNGERRDLPDGSDVHGLLRQLNLAPEKVAVELNRKLLRTSLYTTVLRDEDEVEIVTFVGGG